jgi:hypothetical protein
MLSIHLLLGLPSGLLDRTIYNVQNCDSYITKYTKEQNKNKTKSVALSPRTNYTD